MPRPKLWLAIVVALGVCALFAWEVTTTPEFLVDDSFITFAYSKNLARGLGPTYGQGMVVEGYSNFLWMVILALPLAIARHADPILLAHVAQYPFVLLLLGGMFALARIHANRWLSLLSVLAVAVNVNLILAFDSALETLPYVALICAGFAAYGWSEGSKWARRAVVPLFTAAALTRIDGFIPLGFILLCEAGRALMQRRFSTIGWLRLALPGVAIWAIWFVWRWSYYGLPLPTTYYAKALIPALLPQRGQEYVLNELDGSALWCAGLSFLYLLWRRVPSVVPVGCFALIQLAYAMKVGGDWMPTARFVLPAYPLLIVLITWSAQELVDVVRDRGWSRPYFAAAPALGLLSWVILRSEPHLRLDSYVRYKLAFSVQETRHVASLKRAANFLAPAIPTGGRLVTDYGGVFAYYTDATPIEMWGLCNVAIALHGDAQTVNPIYGRTCPACYPELKPEYFHVAEPMVRGENAFRRHEDVVRGVWQTDTIGRYMDIVHSFASARISDPNTGQAAWFLELKRPGWSPRPRWVSGKKVEYPFSPGGLLTN